LSTSTPAIQHALELGAVAEQYECEGSYAIALEKYQTCLAVLIEHLSREIKGSRRQHLLYQQVYNFPSLMQKNTFLAYHRFKNGLAKQKKLNLFCGDHLKKIWMSLLWILKVK